MGPRDDTAAATRGGRRSHEHPRDAAPPHPDGGGGTARGGAQRDARTPAAPAAAPPSALSRWGLLVARHPVRVLVAWVLVVTACLLPALGVVGDGLFARLTSQQAAVPGEARDGAALLEAAAPTGTTVLLQLDGVDPTSSAVQTALADAVTDLTATPGVVSAAAPLAGAPGAAALVSTDATSVLVSATLDPALSPAAEDEASAAVRARLGAVAADVPGSSARVNSVSTLVDDINAQVEDDLKTGEAVALPITLVVMVLVFGGFLAAGVPLLGALVSIAGGLGSLTAFTHVTDVDSSTVNVVTVLGLGLCIDYGLLVVSRYREELRRLGPPQDAGHQGGAHDDGGHRDEGRAVRTAALAAAMATAGRTVVFSSVTIAISLSGLLVFRADILRSMGLASVAVVLVALSVALSLVPALLALGGARLTRPGLVQRLPGLRGLAARLGDVAPEHGAFSRLALGVQRRPWLVLGGVVVVLGVVASPAAQMQLRSDGVLLLPAGNPSREFFTDLDERFPAAATPTVTLVARASTADVQAYADELTASAAAGTPGLAGATVDAPAAVGDLVTLGVRAPTGADADAQQALLAALQDERPAFDSSLTGQVAALDDFSDDLVDRAPYAIALVVLATFVLLFLLTGSVLVPVKALVANALSLGACLGVLVWVFQEGHLEGLLGFTSTGGVETFVPPLALAFGFGLAMDYEVFLLSRILEARAQGLRTDEAVVAGLQRSGRIITSAALIIVIVFSGFAAGDLLAIKEVGLALAVAVAVDASLVRMLLVPATMTVLGERNWWAPAPLRRLHDRFGISEHAPTAPLPTGPTGPTGPPARTSTGTPGGTPVGDPLGTPVPSRPRGRHRA